MAVASSADFFTEKNCGAKVGPIAGRSQPGPHISQAKAVMRHAPELVDEVLAEIAAQRGLRHRRLARE